MNDGKSELNVKLILVLLFIVIAIISISFYLVDQINVSKKSNGSSNDTDISSSQIDGNISKNQENETNKNHIEKFNEEFETNRSIENINSLRKLAKEIDEYYVKENTTEIEIKKYNDTIKLVRGEIEKLKKEINGSVNKSNNKSGEKQQLEKDLHTILNETNTKFREAKNKYETEKNSFIEKCTSTPLILIGLLIGAIVGGLIAYNWKRDMDKWGMYEKIDRIYTLKISFIIIMILIITLLFFLFSNEILSLIFAI